MFQNKKTPPEILLESIMSYTVQAGKVLEQAGKDKIPSHFDIAISAPGPHYYSGILQAISYLLYQHKSSKKKIALIFTQNLKSKKILFIDKKIGIYLGTKRNNSPMITKLSKKYNNIETIPSTEKFQELLSDQLPFIRIISQTTEILPLFIGSETGHTNNIKVLKELLPKYTLFFISTLHKGLPEEKSRVEDQKIINQITSQKLNTSYHKKFPLIHLFVQFSQELKKKPTTIAYINSGNFGGNTEITTGYTTIIA